MRGLGAVISSLSERRISRHFRTPGLKLTNPRLFAISHGRNSPHLFPPVVFKPVEYQRLQKILSPMKSLITSNTFSINLFLSLREIIKESKGRVAISNWTDKIKLEIHEGQNCFSFLISDTWWFFSKYSDDTQAHKIYN